MATSNEILNIHPGKVPIIIITPKGTPLIFNKTKFIVPRDLTISQFHCILKKYTSVSSADSIILFVNNTLPMVSDTVGSIYDSEKDPDGFLNIIAQKENTFG